MADRSRKSLTVFVALGVLTVVLAVWLRASTHQPTHKGHSLGYWFHRLPLVFAYPLPGNPGPNYAMAHREQAADRLGRTYGASKPTAAQALRAVQAIGTNALPFLIQKLGRRESKSQEWIQASAFKCGIKARLFDNVSLQREQAVTALIVLMPLPSHSVRQLETLSTNADNNIKSAAQCVLSLTNQYFTLILLQSYQ